MNPVKTRKILIVDDQKLFVSGLRQILEGLGNVLVVGEVYNGNEVLNSVQQSKPDIIFLDLNLPKKNGIEVLKDIRKINESVVISILSMYSDRTIALKCREFGANAYLTKDADLNELSKVIYDLKPHDFHMSEQIAAIKNLEEIEEDKFGYFAQITTRELEIIRLLVKGFSSTEIGKELNISPETVKTHRKNIFFKLKINKLSELIEQTYKHGFR